MRTRKLQQRVETKGKKGRKFPKNTTTRGHVSKLLHRINHSCTIVSQNLATLSHFDLLASHDIFSSPAVISCSTEAQYERERDRRHVASLAIATSSTVSPLALTPPASVRHTHSLAPFGTYTDTRILCRLSPSKILSSYVDIRAKNSTQNSVEKTTSSRESLRD